MSFTRDGWQLYCAKERCESRKASKYFSDAVLFWNCHLKYYDIIWHRSVLLFGGCLQQSCGTCVVQLFADERLCLFIYSFLFLYSTHGCSSHPSWLLTYCHPTCLLIAVCSILPGPSAGSMLHGCMTALKRPVRRHRHGTLDIFRYLCLY